MQSTPVAKNGMQSTPDAKKTVCKAHQMQRTVRISFFHFAQVRQESQLY
jgi:hypothetical protein